MLPDFEMIVKKFPEREDIIIVPVFDVHLGARECKEQEFRKFIDMVSKTPNMYLILGGDLVDNGLRNSLTNVFKAVYSPSEQKKMMAKILEPVKDRVLCSVSGNHERRSTRDADDDPAYDIMCKLDIENLHRESMAFLKIQIGDIKGSGDRNPTYMITVVHGAGGGMLTSGAVLRGERSAYAVDGCDLFIFGHTHKPFMTQPGKIVIDPRNEKISIKPIKVLNATSWLEYTDYAAQKMLLPTTHALHTVTLCGKKKEIVVTM